MEGRAILEDKLFTLLSTFSVSTMIQNSIGYYNINHHAENVFCAILNILKDWNLINTNALHFNAVGTDLVDDEKKILVQVTSERTLEKLRESLKKIPDKYKDYKFYHLCFNIIPPPTRNWQGKTLDPKPIVDFSFNNVISLQTLATMISQADNNKVRKILEVLSSYLYGSKAGAQDHLIDINLWGEKLSVPYKRFKMFASESDAKRLNLLISPMQMDNWEIIELASDLIDLKIRMLTNKRLTNSVDRLITRIDSFINLSYIATDHDIEEVHAISKHAYKQIETIFAQIGNNNNLSASEAKKLFLQITTR